MKTVRRGGHRYRRIWKRRRKREREEAITIKTTGRRQRSRRKRSTRRRRRKKGFQNSYSDFTERNQSSPVCA
jgi:hypothetical protein